jgi:hypothetical protein
LALDRDFGGASRNGVLGIDRTSGRRRDLVCRQVRKTQMADMLAEHVSAVQSPDTLGCRVEMADVMIAVDDHHSLARPLNCGEQDIRIFVHRDIVCAHRSIQRPVQNLSRPAPVERHHADGKHSVSSVLKAFRFRRRKTMHA